ncbi:glycosyl hydrolase family 8 [Streptomyces sp.]|uniref:glycosyl hydrolase family 8 n=1 Tax=Streptomyces sp. TaxID=1931 RepID=UPI002F4188B0
MKRPTCPARSGLAILTLVIALVGALLTQLQPAAAAATRYEAENATVSSGTVATNHLNYSGSGFVDTTNATGVYVEFTLNAASAGTGSFAVRYANGTTTDRPMDVSVNGTVVASAVSFPPTADWDTWATKTITAPVTAGSDTIRLTATAAGGDPNLDCIDFQVTAASADYQAEDATVSQGTVATNHLDYTGTGFVDYTNVTGSYVEFTVSPSAAGQAGLQFRYANGTTTDRPMDVSVNGTVVASAVSFPPTADWDTWATKTVNAGLNAGANTIRATATASGGGPNLDRLSVSASTGGDTQPPTAPVNPRGTATTSSSISLAWDASSDNIGVTGYRVREGSSVVASPSGTTVTISGLAASSSHTYTVTARDAAGNESAASAPVTSTTQASTGGPAVPFGSHLLPYAAGTLKPTGSQSTLDQAVISKYNAWKSAFVKQNCGNGWYETYSPDADHPYVAEGQGYGMVIVATMAGADSNAHTIFDGMVKYVLAHPSVHNSNLLAAEQDSSCTSVNGSDSATDGDLDVAYGLLLADKQWGSAGTYNYKDLAIKHINAIKSKEVNSSTHLMLLGDWSTSGDQYYSITRSSDWLIDHFRAFKKATGDSAWDTIRTAHQNLITQQQANYAPSTGLLADFIVNTSSTPRPASGQVLESSNDGDYGWNACRDPWRIGADAVTSGDATSLTQARKLNAWIKSRTGGNPDTIVTGYHLSGSAFDSGHDMAFTAPFAVAAMTDSGSQAWLDALWTKLVSTGINSSLYYGSSVQLQSMIVASGNYWVP